MLVYVCVIKFTCLDFNPVRSETVSLFLSAHSGVGVFVMG